MSIPLHTVLRLFCITGGFDVERSQSFFYWQHLCRWVVLVSLNRCARNNSHSNSTHLTLMRKEIASVMKASKFCLCFPSLRTAGLKLDLTVYTYTHTHAVTLPKQLYSCRVTTGSAWVTPAHTLHPRFSLHLQKERHLTAWLEAWLCKRACLYCLQHASLIPTTGGCMTAFMSRLQLQGSVKRKHTNCLAWIFYHESLNNL